MSYIIAPPPTGPDFPFEGSDKLLATASQGVNEVTLRCHEMTEARENDRFKWLGNGEQLTMSDTQDNILVERNEIGSGFYCCEIYNSSSTTNDVVVFDTYCVTLVFRGEPFFDSRVSLYLTLTPQHNLCLWTPYYQLIRDVRSTCPRELEQASSAMD